ncbi:dihydroneopterin aldolase [uncultured Muribaculum sp.]|uniref:dihydroneopterin aldolase n=1 Tax=uncultured Muribaculum sp. TaxID=1918613 RepID=UPI0025E57116|nr:dihydroneopterin aldolase [uncultured Muribaculum sp.]
MESITIEVNGLRIYARHGVAPQERTVGNLFELTVHLRYPAREAVEHDRLDRTINYAEMVAIAKEVMAAPSLLIENVAGRLKNALLDRFPLIEGGMVRVAKLVPPIPADLDSVAVTLRW